MGSRLKWCDSYNSVKWSFVVFNLFILLLLLLLFLVCCVVLLWRWCFLVRCFFCDFFLVGFSSSVGLIVARRAETSSDLLRIFFLFIINSFKLVWVCLFILLCLVVFFVFFKFVLFGVLLLFVNLFFVFFLVFGASFLESYSALKSTLLLLFMKNGLLNVVGLLLVLFVMLLDFFLLIFFLFLFVNCFVLCFFLCRRFCRS